MDVHSLGKSQHWKNSSVTYISGRWISGSINSGIVVGRASRTCSVSSAPRCAARASLAPGGRTRTHTGTADQKRREMHEEIAKLEKMRNGNPMPIKLIKEGEAEERQVHEGNDREDRQEYIPYIIVFLFVF